MSRTATEQLRKDAMMRASNRQQQQETNHHSLASPGTAAYSSTSSSASAFLTSPSSTAATIDSSFHQHNSTNSNYNDRTAGTAVAPTTPASQSTARAAATMNNNNGNTTNSNTNLAKSARQDWKKYGLSISQALEEKRINATSSKKPSDLAVKITKAETRTDAAGAEYTVYLIDVWHPHAASGSGLDNNNNDKTTIERRYSEFCKLNTALGKTSVPQFPGKHWAGRMGSWTPSRVWFPGSYHELIDRRQLELDAWLVHVVYDFNQNKLNNPDAVHDFLTKQIPLPCQRENNPSSVNNIVDPNWLNPVTFTLGSALRQATRTLQNMTESAENNIPVDLLQAAHGIVFLTVIKAGMVVSGRVGTGLIVSKLQKNKNGNSTNAGSSDISSIENSGGNWSSPCALGTVGLGWGAQIGGDVTHYMVVLTDPTVLSDFCNTTVNLGAELGVAVGPVGRSASQKVQTSNDWALHPAYSYAHSHGLFVGISLESSVVTVRKDVNAKFYGREVEANKLLQTSGKDIKAAESLYEALDAAMRTEIPKDKFRPSQLFKESGDSGSDGGDTHNMCGQ